jgi:hypothetical protein
MIPGKSSTSCAVSTDLFNIGWRAPDWLKILGLLPDSYDVLGSYSIEMINQKQSLMGIYLKFIDHLSIVNN